MEPCPMPLLVRLLKHADDRPAAVEVSGGGYRPQVAMFGVTVDGLAVLTESVRYPVVPAHLSVGVELSDRHHAWLLLLERPLPVPASEVLIPAGALAFHLHDKAPTATGGAVGAGFTVGHGDVEGGGLVPVGAGLGDGAPSRSQVATQG